MNEDKSVPLLIQVISSVSLLAPGTIADLQNIIQFKIVKSNTELLKFGQIARGMYFINQGLARVYYQHKDLDVTDYFAIDGQFIGAVPSVFTLQPSRKAIQIVEDSEVSYFWIKDFEECCAQHHDLERAARKLAYFALVEEQDRIEKLRFYSAAERYLELEKKYPGISNRCPLKYIASYLGISQVSLSRIRAGVQ
ncbi:Crp/Fnr family transcriptional regulator [Adhaeribacter radiodurans]|uniref:Crp/Fnr family transcriptional regulator n=1 Tax=Adhaeribacter radiodurans TaxID=2745197 RepID=A0A7L7L4R8_9BACT|nr:Crp/Fnr family transcriptional regulator [Adhaeribacter radiodurans]QMU27763.1 Crp/Fnr family transcriptional regulator [Adhaeribacter radiodurans]